MGRAIDLTGPPRLNPFDVRKRARLVPSCSEIQTNVGIPEDLVEEENEEDDIDDETFDPIKVLSFLVEDTNASNNEQAIGSAHSTTNSISDNNNANNVARVNVYYQTGTVATCRVLNGQVRQTFRRRCTLDALERILREPPLLTLIDPVTVEDVASTTNDDDAQQEERILRRDIELADTGLAIMAGELDWLQKHAALLEEAHMAASAKHNGDGTGIDADNDEHNDNDDNDSVSSGREYEFHLPEATVTDVEQFLADSVSDPIRCVATNGMGTALIYRSGEWAYTSEGLPKKLKKALNGCKDTGEQTPRYISLGTDGRYFLSFASGLAVWNGPGTLDKALTSGLPAAGPTSKPYMYGNTDGRRHKPISSVAFGQTKDTFFVVFRDGSWEYRGRGIPEGLESILQDRGSRADLETVTLGPGGEWFLQARNGKMWWGGASEEFDEFMEDLEESGRIPRFVDFGDYGSYFVTHE